MICWAETFEVLIAVFVGEFIVKNNKLTLTVMGDGKYLIKLGVGRAIIVHSLYKFWSTVSL